MSNEFFKITSENADDIYDKWRRYTDDEIKAVSAAKSRIYVSVADIELIQDAFESSVANGFLNEHDKRRIMQMGYALEEIKQKLIKDIAKGKKKNAGS